MGADVARIDVETLRGCVLAADEGLSQAVIVVDIVEAEAALDAEPSFVGRAVDAVDIFDAAILDLERHLTADAAERADTFDLAVVVAAVACAGAFGHGGGH